MKYEQGQKVVVTNSVEKEVNTEFHKKVNGSYGRIIIRMQGVTGPHCSVLLDTPIDIDGDIFETYAFAEDELSPVDILSLISCRDAIKDNCHESDQSVMLDDLENQIAMIDKLGFEWTDNGDCYTAEGESGTYFIQDGKDHTLEYLANGGDESGNVVTIDGKDYQSGGEKKILTGTYHDCVTEARRLENL